VISGPSGSGKTTLLNLIGCIDRPDGGDITVAGQAVQRLSDDALSEFRARHIGFIFQSFNLLPVLTAYENVEYPLLFQAVARATRRRRVEEALERVGLAAHARHRPDQLSGGQQQRVAIARALVTGARLILADEPTANLDSRTGEAIIDLLEEARRDRGTTFVMATHDPGLVRRAGRVVRVQDGRVLGP